MPQSDQCTIGEGVSINGRLSGDDEVIVFGRIEGTITLNNHLLVEQGGQVVADVDAQMVSVRGELNGDVVAHQVVQLLAGCLVTGNIRAPRIIIEEGARFRGNIDMDVTLP
ncbi:MAG: polymer-forming cytoskeletal protein [Bradymonadaceae bacterium]|nr:polymer-forming cytoskeletal protein [Lujinxingiaceae bacterium]